VHEAKGAGGKEATSLLHLHASPIKWVKVTEGGRRRNTSSLAACVEAIRRFQTEPVFLEGVITSD
jgi:hypothetical protein